MDSSGGKETSLRRLTIGASVGSKATTVTLAIVLLCLLGLLASLVPALGSLLFGGFSTGIPTMVGIWVGVAFFLGAMALVVGVVLKVWRTAFWLEGTTLVHRTAVRTRRVDLATAEVSEGTIVESAPTAHRTWRTVTSAAIKARDPQTGAVITAPVRTPARGRLPSVELVALADAIMAGRRAEDPAYVSAEAIAARLRDLAADPSLI
jgi:hypothetical protein